MAERFKGVVEETTLKMARKVLGYKGCSKVFLDGIKTYSMRFSDGSLFIIEMCGDNVRTRATGLAAENYRLLLRVMNLTEL